jgi:hypothetical protein
MSMQLIPEPAVPCSLPWRCGKRALCGGLLLQTRYKFQRTCPTGR